MADKYESSSLLLKLIICLIAVASAAVVVTIYHCLTARYTWQDRRIRRPEHDHPTSIDNSLAELLPSHRFRKGVDNGTCTICLCEFEEGEELRTLPECLHSFHSPCIGMWLHSHSNCPVCRTGVGNFDSPMLVQLLHSSSHQPAVIIQVNNVL